MRSPDISARRFTITLAGVIAIGALTLGGALLGAARSGTDEIAASPPVAEAAPAPTTTLALTTSTATTPTTSTTAATTTTNPSSPAGSEPATDSVIRPSAAGSRLAPARPWLTIHGTGDVNLDPDYIPQFRSTGYAYAWEGLGGLFQSDDLTVINLECSPSPLGSPLPKAFNFRCDQEALAPTRRAGIEVANLANNHGQDYGVEAMLDGRRRVAGAGIAPVGVGADAAEAHRPARFDVHGWRVAVLGFGGVVPAPDWIATDERPGMADGDTIETMTAAVAAAAEQADLVIVSIHWGVELDTTPRADDIARAEAMIDAGADIIFGHHSHRLNPLGWYKGRPIFWGLGNFVWPQLSPASATTGVARVIVSPAGELQACIIPAYIARAGQPVLTADPPCAAPAGTDPRTR